VIVFEPVYDSYVPAIETVGGTAVLRAAAISRLRAPDWAQVAR
jgi:methionine aminotransferase